MPEHKGEQQQLADEPADELAEKLLADAEDLLRERDVELARAEERAYAFELFAERLGAAAGVHAKARTLDERMAAVQLELEDVPRRGHAEIVTKSGARYEYDYITEADLMAGVRPLLAKHGVAVYYSDRIVSIENGLARVAVEILLRANGETVVLSGEGIGTDLGDKHANKAKTAAVRYLLWKTFLQPSDEDPEQENVAADDAARADATRRTSSRSQPRGRGADPRERTLRLSARVVELAGELDVVQGRQPGYTQGRLDELVPAAFGQTLEQLRDADDHKALVSLGQQIGLFVTAQREQAEKLGDDGPPQDELVLDGGTGE